MPVVTVKKLLENGVHFGHQTRRWDPKCKSFIYTQKGGNYIIDLEKTLVYLDEAYASLKSIVDNGGKILFVGTKKQSQEVVMNEALRSGSFYVNQRWLGGILTNFKTIQKRIKRLLEIEEMESTGSINVYHKKEIAMIRKEAVRLENFLGGIKEMKKLPSALIVVDPKDEHNAVAEAKKLGIPVFGLVDTNCDPAYVDFPIPANDDAVKSITLIMKVLADAIVESKAGILEEAYQHDASEQDITMSDVIVSVEKYYEENERRRRQREERRPRNSRFSNNTNSERRFVPRKDENKTETSEVKNVNTPATDETKPDAEPTPVVETKPVVEPTPVVETKPVVETAKEDKPVAKKEKKVKTEDASTEEKKVAKKTTKVAKEEKTEKSTKTTKKTVAKEEEANS